jgi:hypothetical protein
VFVPGIGDDTFVCDSGTSPGGLTDLNGSNTLLLPDGGAGSIDGNVALPWQRSHRNSIRHD